ncbi:MAG: response regulator [Candidatus Paceibacterota bacterium]|jgi:two-component system alkaline phosphatase synthesis response regulator PhoP
MSKKIAIIEDDIEISDMYKIKLELGGYVIVSAENGTDGLKLIKSEKPDLVLLDLLLPEKDGYEVMEELKKSNDPYIKSLPIVVISNLSNEDDILEAKNLGATDFLVKAKINPASVLEKVNLVLQAK